jgi:hypothetical protein
MVPQEGWQKEHWFNVRDAPIFAAAGTWRPSAIGDAFAFLSCG